MLGEFKRPTKLVELPSGKKVEIVTYLSNFELDEIRARMTKGQKIKGEQILEIQKASKEGEPFDESALFAGMEFELGTMNEATQYTRFVSIKKLIDADGTEYEADEKTVREFFDEADGVKLDGELNAMNKKKVVLTEKNSQEL